MVLFYFDQINAPLVRKTSWRISPYIQISFSEIMLSINNSLLFYQLVQFWPRVHELFPETILQHYGRQGLYFILPTGIWVQFIPPTLYCAKKKKRIITKSQIPLENQSTGLRKAFLLFDIIISYWASERPGARWSKPRLSRQVISHISVWGKLAAADVPCKLTAGWRTSLLFQVIRNETFNIAI